MSAADAARPSEDSGGRATSVTFPRHPVRALVHAWLVLDFFAESRRSGQPSSSLTTTIFGQAFLALVFAALLFPDTPPGAFAAANLSLSTLMVGIGHLGDEAGAARARADRVLVATSPLTGRAVLAARALHASFYVGLLTVGMALPPAILTAFLPGQGLLSVPSYVALACACAGLLTAALALLMHGLERAFGTARAQLASGTLKALLLLGGLVAFAQCGRQLHAGVAGLPLPAWLVYAWPPYHGGRAISGHIDGVLVLLATFTVLVLSVLPLARAAEPRAAGAVATPRVLDALNRHLCGARPRQLAIVAFTSAMLYRSPGLRGRVLPLFGLPAGMWLLALLDHDPGTARRMLAVAAQLPAVYLPFLIAFLGGGDEPRARWCFDTSPGLTPPVLRAGIAVALTTHVLLPVHVILFAVSITATGLWHSLGMSAFGLGLAVLVAKLALRSWDDIPFSHPPATHTLEFGGILTFAIALTLVALLAAALPLAVLVPLGVASLAAAHTLLRRGTR